MVSAGSKEVFSGVVCMNGFVLGSVEDTARHPQHSTDRQALVHTFVLVALDDHFRVHRIQRELCHSPSQLRELALRRRKQHRHTQTQGERRNEGGRRQA